MTLLKLTFNLLPKSKTPFLRKTWGESTNLFIDGWSRSSFELLSPCCCCSFNKASCNQEKTTHACYWSTRGLEIKHKSNDIDKTHVFGTGKVSFSLISIWINLQWFLRPATVPRSWSWAPPLLFCPPTAVAWISPKAWGKAKGLGQKGLDNLAEFLCYDFSPPE